MSPTLNAQDWLARIHALPIDAPVRMMNVCGGHERSISMAGLRSALPTSIELIAGPGCPVCVCPEEDVYLAMQIAQQEDVILLAFGDMLRVPVNVPKNESRTLEQVKAAGAFIKAIASPLEAIKIALENPNKRVVFFAAGFETTMAPVAAMLLQGVPKNLSLLLSGRLTWPAVAMLLNSGDTAFDALIAPGHVAMVMGSAQWNFVVTQHRMPTAVAGFTPVSLLAAMYSVVRQHLEGNPFLDNCYPELVRPHGNASAQKILAQAFDVQAANWRGIGVIPASGYVLNTRFDAHDARLIFPDLDVESRRRRGEMPAGCDCAKVVMGQIKPNQCQLFGRSCVPKSPIGPCMVSDEGACRIWWASGVRADA